MNIFVNWQLLLGVSVAVGLFVFTLKMLWHMLSNKRIGTAGKAAWIFGMFFFYPLGALYYFYRADLYRRSNWRTW